MAPSPRTASTRAARSTAQTPRKPRERGKMAPGMSVLLAIVRAHSDLVIYCDNDTLLFRPWFRAARKAEISLSLRTGVWMDWKTGRSHRHGLSALASELGKTVAQLKAGYP
jgi:hypothetical protein